MDKQLSRPVRWKSAVNRAIYARGQLQKMRDELVTLLEEYEARWSETRDDFVDAVADLRCLQSEYSIWTVPDNFWDGPLQQKLHDMEALNLKEMAGEVPKFEDLFQTLNEFNPSTDGEFDALDEARELDLPKGYGRD